MTYAGTRGNRNDRISNYEIPKNKRKAAEYNMSKYNGGGFLDNILRTKKYVPSPQTYKVVEVDNFNHKYHNPIVDKAARIT